MGDEGPHEDEIEGSMVVLTVVASFAAVALHFDVQYQRADFAQRTEEVLHEYLLERVARNACWLE